MQYLKMKKKHAVNEFIQGTTANYTKWLQKWFFVPDVLRYYQSGDLS